MASDKRGSKKDAGLEVSVKDLRQQLADQLRCLDGRVDLQTSLLFELQEFFRKRADIELEYSRNLDKLHKTLSQRHKDLKQRRDQVQLFSSYTTWQQLTAQTRQEAKDRATLGDIYSTVLPQKLARLAEDLQRIYRRCRQICTDSHDELLKLITELQAATKTYNMYYTHFSSAESKLQYVVNQKAKLEVNLPEDKLDKSRKFRLVEKEIVKRRNKYQATRLQALRARNDFILCLEAANAALHRYFSEDLPDAMDCSDVGVHTTLERALKMAAEGYQGVVAGEKQGAAMIVKMAGSLDARLDKQKYIEANNAPFQLPKKFEFVACKGDIMSRYDVDPAILEETQQRYDALCRRIESLRASTDEQWKTMETAERSLLSMAGAAEVECAAMFLPTPPVRPCEIQLAKQRADHIETGQFYVSKFAEFVAESNLLARLQVKRELLRSGLSEHTPELGERPAAAARPRRARLGQPPADGQPKLFGGSLEEYLERSGQQIPLIVRSCIRVINLFGLHHQGIFRVSGSQVEINNFRDGFERGEDPLADVTDASDINSVAGVLKLYLRELREPFFPTTYFGQLMKIAQLPSPDDRTLQMREVVSSLPFPVQIVMRYLFAFLSHLSEFSDENMMEPYNLAICFGPTLLPIPESQDQVQFQNLVNELMKHIILWHEHIFPRGGGAAYEKYISKEEAEEVGEAPAAGAADEPDLGPPSEDDSLLKEKERELSLRVFGKYDQLEAVAQFDFTARSPRELSFRCGDVLTLYRQVSSDWWRGAFRGHDGLVPDKYIMLKIRDEERASGSDTSSQPRRSVSGETAAGRNGRAPSATLSSASSQSTLLDSSGSEERAWIADRSATLPRGGPPTPAPRAASLALLHRPGGGRAAADGPSQARPAGQDGVYAAGYGGAAARASGHTEIYIRSQAGGRRGLNSGVSSMPSSVNYSIEDSGGQTAISVVTDSDAAAAPGDAAEECVSRFSPRQRPLSSAEQHRIPTEEEKRVWARQDVTSSTASIVDMTSSLTSSSEQRWTDEEDNSASAKDNDGEESCEEASGEASGGELEQAVREIALVSERLRQVELDLEHAESDPPPPPAPASARAVPRRGVPTAADLPQQRASPPAATSVLSRRALWETRAAADQPPLSATAGLASLPAGSRRALKHTPDLVMDLPAEWGRLQRSGSGSSEEGGVSTPSTAAETFARQNQCTVKRSGRISPVGAPAVRPDPPEVSRKPAAPAPTVRRPSASAEGVSVTQRAGMVARSLSAVHSNAGVHGAAARPLRPVSAVYVPADGGGPAVRPASAPIVQRLGRPAGSVDTLGGGGVTVEHTNPASEESGALRPQARVKPQPARKPSPKHLRTAAQLPES